MKISTFNSAGPIPRWEAVPFTNAPLPQPPKIKWGSSRHKCSTRSVSQHTLWKIQSQQEKVHHPSNKSRKSCCSTCNCSIFSQNTQTQVSITKCSWRESNLQRGCSGHLADKNPLIFHLPGASGRWFLYIVKIHQRRRACLKNLAVARLIPTRQDHWLSCTLEINTSECSYAATWTKSQQRMFRKMHKGYGKLAY